MKGKRAFTFLEMIIVVAILAMVSTIVVPRVVALMGGQASRDFQSALLRLGSEARLLAMETGNTVQVTYDSSLRTITVETLDSETFATEEQQTIELPESADLTSFTLGGEPVSDGDWIVEFFPDGSGMNAGVEVEDGSKFYSVRYDGQEGTAFLSDAALAEVEETEWEAGELELRVQ